MSEKQQSEPKQDDPRIGVYVCHCGFNIAGSVDCEEVTRFATGLPHVVLAQDNRYTCSDQGQEGIDDPRRDYQKHEPTNRFPSHGL